jgi:hypothetical protein
MKSGPNVVEASVAAVNGSENDADVSTRRSYRAPTVRALGRVRDLTLGSAGAVLDGIGGRTHP